MSRHIVGALACTLALSAAAGPASAQMAPQRLFTGAEPARVAAATQYAISGGTLFLSGSMSSVATIAMTGAFSVGHASSLAWKLPRPRSLNLSGYTESISSTSYKFSVQPTSSRVGSYAGSPVSVFSWAAPPANTVIRVVEVLHVHVRSTLGRFHNRASYPVGPLPANVRPFTRITRHLALFRHGQSLARRLTLGRRTEQQVVESVANWVASHLRYDPNGDTHSTSAAWVMKHPGTTCRGYANAMAALLHYQGIPAQVEYGWVSAAPINLSGPNGASSRIQWGSSGSQGDMHAWLQIYFPGAGWVPFDPQHEKFFIDPRHFGFATYADAGSPQIGDWKASAPNGQNATGTPLSNGYPEIAPGDGVGSKITVSSHDTFRATMDGIRHDVHGVLLLSR
ncbi:MAG: hypothetical protein NVS2B16_15010 [Chloroflexota bacterium]